MNNIVALKKKKYLHMKRNKNDYRSQLSKLAILFF